MPQGGYMYRVNIRYGSLAFSYWNFNMIQLIYITADHHFEMTDDSLFEMTISLINF